MKWIALVLSLSGFGLAACRTIESPPATTSLQTSTPAVTRLETPTPIKPTRLESGANAPTSTTTISVQQAITDLQAQRTSEGLRVNLPENILFDFDKSDIRPNAKPTLQKLSVLLKTYQNSPTEIRGYTDSKGSNQYNQSLSERRAKAVESYLVQNFQVNGDRLTPKGFGKTQPIAPNTKPDGSDNPEGRQKNRRHHP
ncbi:MAG: hypothetical protein C4287_18900 [Leptolyngbya sp. ERB_1_2]